MNDFDPALNSAPAPSTPGARVEAALSAVVDMYGPTLFYEPDRLKAALDQACPDAPREISLTLMALAEEVPQQLLAAHSDAEVRVLLPRLVKRLIDRAVFDRASASWVVRAWTHALALPSTGLDGSVAAAAAQRRPAGLAAATAPTVLHRRLRMPTSPR